MCMCIDCQETCLETKGFIEIIEKESVEVQQVKDVVEIDEAGPNSSSGRASASGSGGRRFDPRPRHTKGVKNGTGSSLADARNKRVVPGRYKKAGKYLLRIFVMSHNSS